MKIDIRHNLPGVSRWLLDTEKQTRFATSRAINLTANAVRDDLRAEARSVFDRVTPYVLGSLRVQRYSTRQKLEAEVAPVYRGGKGVEPEKVLRAEIFGGPRGLKRSERALQRAGILPAGYYTVPGEAAPLDAFGNIKGSFLVQLLTYFQAMGEQGYKANMTAKRKASLAKRGRSQRGFATINGVEYFVAHGGLRGGRSRHLAPGIYTRRGIHGSDVQPVLMFVRSPSYRVRFDMLRVGQRTVARTFGAHFERSMADAIRTARPAGSPR